MQHWFWTTFGWPLVLFGIAYAVYILILKPKMTEVGAVLRKPGVLANTTGFGWLWEKINGWKTIILSTVAGLAQMGTLLPQFLDPSLIAEWQSLPWANIVDAKMANMITLVCTFLIPITHTVGILQAAKTPPLPPSTSSIG